MTKTQASAASESTARAQNTDLSRLYKFGATLSYLLSALPFIAMLVLPTFGTAHGIQIFILVYLLSCGFAGYGVQMLGGRLLRIQRKPEVYSYEDKTRRYRIEQALFCHIGAVVLWLISTQLGHLLTHRFAGYYDQYSLYPVLIAVFAFFMTEFGGYLWFIPYNTLISTRNVAMMAFVMFGAFLVYKMYGFDAGLPVMNAAMYLSLIVILALFVLLLNQAFITRPYGGKIARGINDAAKVYSARIVGIALCIVALVSVVAMAVIVALVRLWYAIFKFFLARLVSSNTGGDMDRINEILTQDYAGALLDLPQRQSDNWLTLFVIFAVIVITFLIVLFTPALREKLKELIAYLKEAFMLLFRTPFDKRAKQQTRETLNFVDTEEKTRVNLRGNTVRTDDIRNYADFAKRLEQIPTLEDRIKFAYAVCAGRLRHQNLGVRVSDTPREIAHKVKAKDMISDIDTLTATFERLQYENAALGAGDESTLTRLCVILQNLL